MTTLTPSQDAAVQERWGKEDFQNKLEAAFWMNHPVVLGHLNRLATGKPRCDWLTWFSHDCIPTTTKQSVLVLGCGEGWLERSIAELPWIERIDAFDVAEGAVDRARERAQEAGLDNIHYGVLDLNTEALEPNAYDVVIAHSVLHHIEGLEHAFSTIQASLRPGAWIAISEYIGPPHLQYRDEAMEIMNEVMGALNPRLRTAVTTGELLETKERPALEYILEVDPSEGVRADELEQFIRDSFAVVYEAPTGGTVLQHLLWELVANFQQGDAVDTCLLEWICFLEESLCDAGALPSDYHFYVCRGGDEVGGDLPTRLAFTEPALPRRSAPADEAWREHPAAGEHFHRVATGHPGCDWLTRVLGELEEAGLDAHAQVLWLGGDGWMLDVLRDRFSTVVVYSRKLLLTSIRSFDAAFGIETGLLQNHSSWACLRSALLVKPTGTVVAIESRPHSETAQQWVDRFARPLATATATPFLPKPTSGPESTSRVRACFEEERATNLGGDLLDPILNAYWSALPTERREDALRLLAVVEAEALRRGVFESKSQGLVLARPSIKRLLRTRQS